jgi:hypothetical protein
MELIKKCESCGYELPKGMNSMCYDCYNDIWFGGHKIMTTKEWLIGVLKAVVVFGILGFSMYLLWN